MSKRKKENPNRGSSLDDLLADEGVLQKFQAAAIKRVIAWQLQREMENQNITKQAMAEKMKTSRTQLNRLLDPENQNVTIETLQRAAVILGKEVRVELV